MIRFVSAVVVLTLLVVSLSARGEDVAQPVPVNRKCSVKADPQWTSQEKFVWRHVCVGEVADFNAGSDYGGNLDPKRPEGLPASRILRPVFLETILLADKYRHALTRNGVRISGARFTETIDLSNAQLAHDLLLVRSLLEKGADFIRAKSAGIISISGSNVVGTLEMNGLQVEDLFLSDGAAFGAVDLRVAYVSGQINLNSSKVAGMLNANSLHDDGNLLMTDKAEFGAVVLHDAHVGGQIDLIGSKVAVVLIMEALRVDHDLLMQDKAEFGAVLLRDAHIGGQLALYGLKVAGTLNMDRLQVDHSLFMHNKAEFGAIVLRNAHVGGQVALAGSKVAGALDMDSLQVDHDLLMDNKAEFGAIVLHEAHVGGQIDLIGSKVAGTLIMDSLQVGSDVYLGNGAEFDGPIDLVFGKVGGNLDLAGGLLKSTVDLTGTQIGGQLDLGLQSLPARWSTGSALILRNAKVDAIQDLWNSWPDKLDLNGFTYRSLGGLKAAEGDPMIDRSAGWFEGWLGKQKPYAAGPYQQLASVLREQGKPDVANDVLFAGRERERGEACVSWSRVGSCVWLSFLSSAAGYGIGFYTFRVLNWVICLTVLGAFFLWFSPNARRHGPLWIMGASLHRLLPIVELSKGFTKFFENSTTSESWRRNLNPFQEVYFALHALLGWALGLILLAAMGGIIQKS